MSILFHHYKELKEYISEVERIDEARAKNTSKNKQWLTIREEVPTTVTLNGYFIDNNANFK